MSLLELKNSQSQRGIMGKVPQHMSEGICGHNITVGQAPIGAGSPT